MRDKGENYAIISFDIKTINKKILPVPLRAYFFFSKVQAIVRLYDHPGPFTGHSFLFFCFFFILNSNSPLLSLEHNQKPKTFLPSLICS